MADLGENGFDADGEYDNILPEGWYTCAIVGSDVTAPSEKNPQGLVTVRFRVVEGEHAKREVQQVFNIFASNPTAKSIAQKQLQTVAHACGIKGTMRNTDVLLNKVVKVKFTVTRGKSGGVFQNLADAKSLGDAIAEVATTAAASKEGTW